MLLRPEETIETVHFLTKGIIAESTSNANGLEKLSLIYPCYPEALSAALHQQPIVYTAYAFTPCEIISLPIGALLTLMQDNCSLLENILRLLALEARNANNLILQNIPPPPPKRSTKRSISTTSPPSTTPRCAP